MAKVEIGTKATGEIVYIKESEVLKEFIVIRQGALAVNDGYTALIRKDIYSKMKFSDASSSHYPDSKLDTWNSTIYLAMLDAEIQQIIPELDWPYTVGDGDANIATVRRKIVAPSGTELGTINEDMNTEGVASPYFDSNSKRIATYNGTATNYWTRSARKSTANFVMYIQNSGAVNYASGLTSNTYGTRPEFAVPSNTYVGEDGTLIPSAGGREMLIPSEKLEAGAEYGIRMFPRNKRGQFQSGIGGSRLKILNQVGETAAPDDSVPEDIIPSYTGNSQIFGDGQKGYIECYTSGMLSFNTDATVDIFLVGGGGGGGARTSYDSNHGGGGGGGGG